MTTPGQSELRSNDNEGVFHIIIIIIIILHQCIHTSPHLDCLVPTFKHNDQNLIISSWMMVGGGRRQFIEMAENSLCWNGFYRKNEKSWHVKMNRWIKNLYTKILQKCANHKKMIMNKCYNAI